MKKFTIEISQTRKRVITVEAYSLGEAECIVDHNLTNGTLTLDDNNSFYQTQLQCLCIEPVTYGR